MGSSKLFINFKITFNFYIKNLLILTSRDLYYNLLKSNIEFPEEYLRLLYL